MEPTNKTHRIILISAIAVLFAGVSGGGVWYYMNQQDKAKDELINELSIDTATKEAHEHEEEEKTETKDEADGTSKLVYSSARHGYKLTFPDKWADYVAVNTDAGVAFYLEREKELTYGDTSLQNTHFSMFAVDVFSKDEWNIIISSEGPKPDKLKESGDKVFGLSMTNGTANLKNITFDEAYSDIPKIGESLELIE